MPLTELEQEYYSELLNQETPAEPETPIEPPAEEIVAEAPVETPETPIVETPVAEVSAPVVEIAPRKKYVAIDDEANLWETLDKKYRWDRMKPEEKALAFIKQQNPGIDDDELAFLAATDYGIGADAVDEAELTPEQVIALKKQDIARKQLIYKADEFFKEEAGKITLTGEDPLDLDPEYKEYQTTRQTQLAEQKAQQEQYATLEREIQTTSKQIPEISELLEIDLDDSKFAIDVKFKLDENKQKQLVDYTKQYIPTDNEVKQFTDANTGKFDYKAYMTSLAPKVFAKEIMASAVRQALAQDRQKFVEVELKNSTLRNNDVSTIAQPKKVELYEAWPFGG